MNSEQTQQFAVSLEKQSTTDIKMLGENCDDDKRAKTMKTESGQQMLLPAFGRCVREFYSKK